MTTTYPSRWIEDFASRFLHPNEAIRKYSGVVNKRLAYPGNRDLRDGVGS